MESLSLPRPRSWRQLSSQLNSRWHEPALISFLVIVLAHWAEHIVQAVQIFWLAWPRPEARGLLGQFWPWLVTSELLHYGYAFVMLVGIWILRKGFTGRSYFWWMVSFWIQFWHHIEHALLQAQALLGHNILGRPVPTSILQIWIPRAELHMFYNTAVFIPMVYAMYLHRYAAHPEGEEGSTCSCSRAMA
jgi:hypothetical protein